MDSDSVMCFHLIHAITILLFLSSCVCADRSPASYCFVQGGDNKATCTLPMEYPLLTPDAASQSCGYPGFEVFCSYRDRAPVISISGHVYHVLDISYKEKKITLLDVDISVDGNLRPQPKRNFSLPLCPQPKRNFSLPSSPSWVNYHLPQSDNFITIFHDCNSNLSADAENHLLCPPNIFNINNTTPSDAFYKDEVPKKGSDWYRDCTWNVVIPVSDSYGLASNKSYTDAIKTGFVMEWSATGWCEDCELSGGRCWSNSTGTGCACKDNDTVCLAPHHQGIIAALIIAFCMYNLLCIYRRRIYSTIVSYWRKKITGLTNVEVFLENYGYLAIQRYTYSDIKKLTNSFNETLGQGGYGSVFKGKLRDGHLVAVKVLNEAKGKGEDFINEVAAIGRTNHVNVVSLLGFCTEKNKRALVYEYMPNGSLEKFIYSEKNSSTSSPLGREKLYEIALGIARGLEYLHRGCTTRVLHLDIKPHNILLDQDFRPRISDFGLAKLCPTKESLVSMVGTRGTPGYIAPEVYCRNFGGVSHKSDVYSYGMMVLEMIGGRKNIDASVENMSEIYFPQWVYKHLERQKIEEGTEDNILQESSEFFKDEKMKKMILIALWCIQPHPGNRPSMSKVVEMLEGSNVELQVPPNPFPDPSSITYATTFPDPSSISSITSSPCHSPASPATSS